MLKKVALFLALNFGSLALSGYFTGIGVPSVWYQTLTKAPWTPAGWVFGTAWTIIMLTFSVYMAILLTQAPNKRQVIKEYVVQWILNISWSPLFFYYHKLGVSLLGISLLSLTVTLFLIKYMGSLRYYTLLIVPYFLWLLIATSLNGYAFWFN